MPSWTRTIPVADIPPGGARTVKQEGKQLAVFRAAAAPGTPDEIHAVDNRCPHEGYPLAQGIVQDGMLTCEWHNWKFRLCDGVCVLGGEDVRRYPVRVEDGAVWIDLADPPAAAQAPRLYEGIAEAVDERDWGWLGRTLERLLALGEPPQAILAHGIELAALRAPYGVDHGPAASADAAALLRERPEDASLILLQALNLALDGLIRLPARTLAPASPVPADPERELRAAIEREDLAAAEGLIRGALAAGTAPSTIIGWLSAAATDHFYDYGHAHIYCVKLEELIAALGGRAAEAVLCGLAANMVFGTREDRLPYMRAYGKDFAVHAPRLAAWCGAAPADGPVDVDALLAAVLDGDLPDALSAVARALDAGAAPARVALALALAAAHRIQRFDADLEQRDDVSEGWLHVTHALTHGDAVRETLLRHPSAATLRGLFHSARFIQHMAPLDLPPDRRPAPLPPPDPDALCRSTFTDLAVVPIFVMHHIKTSFAARRLTAALAADPLFASRPDRALPLSAAARFIDAPLRERRIARASSIAQTFVRTGRRHHALLGY
jgi:nitrite reductase/ring-hydroxylating ferredoxin subunit